MTEQMTEQELVAFFKEKVDILNATIERLAESGIYVDFELTNYQRSNWERETCHIHAIVNKVL